MNTLVTMMSGLVGVEGALGAADGVCGRSIWRSPDTWSQDFAERRLYLFISCGFTEALRHCLTGVQSHHKEQPPVFRMTVLWVHEVINTQISQLATVIEGKRDLRKARLFFFSFVPAFCERGVD